ncbi:MAG: phosphohydrolase [Arcobacter sp.]|nr:MAG: phosphohydrolase [Arcobacter sp.]
MDKKKEIQFNLNNFLLSVSLGLELVEKDIHSTTNNHSKRVAYISLKIGQQLNLKPQELSDLCAYSLAHNVALKKKSEYNKEHLELTQELVDKLPFLCGYRDVLKYYREYFDGSGIFGLKNNDIPLFSQIISFSHILDDKFDLSGDNIENRKGIVAFLEQEEEVLFSKEIVDKFLDASSTIDFWLDMQNENDILYFIFGSLYDFTISPRFEEVLTFTSVFDSLIEGENNFLDLCSKMSDFYKFDHKDKYTFLIAASLHKIGKLAIPKKILDKKESLTDAEYEVIKSYPYYTKKILNNLMGFNDITNWACRVQESIDGTGYPYKLSGKELSLKDRLMAVLNIYYSLINKKSYRNAYSHNESIEIMRKLAITSKLDSSIVEDVDTQFS